MVDREIIAERRGKAGIIWLNRPKAINSLNETMVHEMKAALDAFAFDPDIACLILLGNGERGLCAGGDVKAIYDARNATEQERTRFWREEFPLNYSISRYPKPYVAVMDGIVMGGGVGIAAHGRHRIVTERTRLAMPETAIGYFPDVGTTWLLPKSPGETGTWLGLTGREIGAADAIYVGLADHHVLSNSLPELMDALADVVSAEDVRATIDKFSSEPAQGFLAADRSLIDRTFGFDTVEEMLAALEAEDNPFAAETIATLNLRSPTSLKLALRLLRKGRESSGLVECLEREFVAGCEVLRGHDFYEGVRAALVDKDRNPRWKPNGLADVSKQDVDRYFVPTSAPLFPDHRL
nr:enoyl-CoA hydratase/isomerase family protein [Agrobacterium larrymoorei]